MSTVSSGRPGTALVRLPEFGPFDDLSDVAHRFYIDGFAQQALAACRHWRPLSVAADDVQTTRYLTYIEGIALQELGRHEEAAQVASGLVASLGDRLEPVWRAKGLAMVAESCTRIGELGRAMASIAEADWLIGSIRPGTYGHLSASMAVALALRSLNLYEQADDLLRGSLGNLDPDIELLVLQELALLSAYWGTTLGLIGESAEAGHHYRLVAQRALAMQRAARNAGNHQMAARGVAIEAYATMRLGDVELAAARAAEAAEVFGARAELLETHLVHLVLGRAASGRGSHYEARVHLTAAGAAAAAARRDTWSAAAMEALAEVDVAERGEHPAVAIWRNVARTALARVWAEREGRFAALQDRNHMRELSAETDRMGLAVLQDPLTGLGNRRLLVRSVESAVEALSVVFVDVDDFKVVNDDFSHTVGDEVLRRIADLLRSHCRVEDVLVRYGGDEFVILTSGGAAAAEVMAHRVHEAVRAAPWHEVAEGLAITVSIGVGHSTSESHNPLAAADTALGAAKRAGRDRVVRGAV